LNRARALRRLRFDMNFAERRFVLADVLLQYVEQGLGLLRAEIDTLEILNIYDIRGILGDQAEHEEEIPEIRPDLDAVGVALAIIGAVNKMDFGSGIGIHNEKGALLRSRLFLQNSFTDLTV